MVRHLPFLFPSRERSGERVMSILESERLILRPPRPADIPAMTVWLGDFAVSRNLARVPHPYTEADAEDFVGHARPAWRGPLQLRHHRARTTACSWAASACIWKRRAMNSAIGWASRSGARAMPPKRRAAGRCSPSSDLEAPSVWAGWFHDNPASGHVLAKLGARHNGSRMRDCLARGHDGLCHEMLLTRDDFLRKRPHTAPINFVRAP